MSKVCTQISSALYTFTQGVLYSSASCQVESVATYTYYKEGREKNGTNSPQLLHFLNDLKGRHLCLRQHRLEYPEPLAVHPPKRKLLS